MSTIDDLLDTISNLADVVRIQREIIKGLGGEFLPTTGNFDLRSINQDLLKNRSSNRKHKCNHKNK
ncbi:hypothetical protein [Bacteroides caccae]|uniref:hypothetical protein n=1 Tax=Bacteroides caccae TaxID=47678 RepID=UPI00234D1CC1|nr:hypothetical protein [Bacteroides caccae]MDC7127681.1 hypothetical protein [Bacteroides caccae]